jgi:hypothetical protein
MAILCITICEGAATVVRIAAPEKFQIQTGRPRLKHGCRPKILSAKLIREKEKVHMNTTARESSAQSHPDTQPEEFDVMILGGGTGSTIAAWTFASEGKRVAAIDRKYIGGSCPNIACLPSKNIIHTAKVTSYARHSEKLGFPPRISRSTCRWFASGSAR